MKFDLAETAYREASRAGFEPQPGLALLRLAQGDTNAAATASRRMVGATRDRHRADPLPARARRHHAGGGRSGRSARREPRTPGDSREPGHRSSCRHCRRVPRGSVDLDDGNPRAVLDPVRRAFGIWQQIGAPYLAARLRVLLARACAALGDIEGAQLELECAREVFERLGAQA